MKEKDPRYDFHITVSVHLILENANHKILMGRRPTTWEWAPGRWGLIGGKIYEHESFADCIKRKTLQELSFAVSLNGLFQMRQLIIPDKQAHMYFFVGQYSGQKIKGALAEYNWLGKDDFKKMANNEFGEFFYKRMLLDYLDSKPHLIPVNQIVSLNYIDKGKTPSYKNWFKGVVNKDFDPNEISDYKTWKKSKRKS